MAKLPTSNYPKERNVATCASLVLLPEFLKSMHTRTAKHCRANHGAHPILVVKGPSDQEILIPFVAAYVLGVDAQAKQIQVDWQEDY